MSGGKSAEEKQRIREERKALYEAQARGEAPVGLPHEREASEEPVAHHEQEPVDAGQVDSCQSAEPEQEPEVTASEWEQLAQALVDAGERKPHPNTKIETLRAKVEEL
jgi:hypothetical protein